MAASRVWFMTSGSSLLMYAPLFRVLSGDVGWWGGGGCGCQQGQAGTTHQTTQPHSSPYGSY
jgi:hypothetical protein